jgi:hypothetical protein
MTLFNDVVKNIENRKRRRESGLFNSIPCPFPKLNEYYSGIEKGKYELVTANKKAGKCFGKETKILMYNGSTKNVEDIIENDLVMGPDSLPRKVSGINSGQEQMFIINRKGHNPIRVNESHILYLYNIRTKSYLTMSVKDYNNLLPTQKTYYKWCQSEPVNFHKEDVLKIDPYFYGLWLGDGHSTETSITNVDPEIIDYLYWFADDNNLNIHNKGITYYLKSEPLLIEYKNDYSENILYWNSLSHAAKKYNIRPEYISRATKSGKVVNNSFWEWKSHRGDFKKLFEEECGFDKTRISKKYLLSNIDSRREILAGLIDSDGYLDKKGSYEICLKQKSLIQDIIFLCQSLGIKCSIGKDHLIKETHYYRIRLSGQNLLSIPCKVLRKRLNKDYFTYNCLHQSFTIQKDKIDDYYGFTVDKDHLFLLNDFSIVHNTQFTDFMYVYHPVRFCMDTQSDLNIKVHYICLEMTKEQKMIQAMCHFLYADSNGAIRVSPAQLRSKDRPLDTEVLNAILKYEKFFISYLDKVQYVDTIRTVTEINQYTEQLCQRVDPKSEQITELIIDHISLVTPRRGQTVKQAIDELSASTFVKARNNYRINPVVVQQQANDKESLDAKKMGDLLPSFSGLSDSKDTARDIDFAFGVFSPHNAKMQMYGGINVTKYNDNLRILNIIGGRESSGNKEVALYFDGAVSKFNEL